MNAQTFDAQLSESQFSRIAELVHRVTGINLRCGKQTLVCARLSKRLRSLGLASFKEYLDLLEGDQGERETLHMIDALTTNKTNFFREPAHFEFLREVLVEQVRRMGPRLRLWSAGCSTGEEPYSLAITLYDALSDPGACDTRILATDISERVLATARAAEYSLAALEGVPRDLRLRHFEPSGEDEPASWRLREHIRRWVSFARLNLMEPWPMHGPFDAIMCRNVMIYFDKPTQRQLVDRFCALLRPGGWLLVGHSESLNGVRDGLRYIQPAVYAV